MFRFFIFSGLLVLFSCSAQKEAGTVSYRDADLDGINDNKDACPKESGSVFNLGCPHEKSLVLNLDKKLSTDNDLDGVRNDKDECPDIYGSPFNQGCPFLVKAE